MPGKRTRTASSSPHYERVLWVEKKTARGTKITAKASDSPRTPKIKKQATPGSKKRRMELPLITPIGPSTEVNCPLTPPMPIKLKKKPGKVTFLKLSN